MPGSSVPPAAEVVPRWTIRDPDAWLRFVAWLVVLFAAVQIATFSFGRDQGIYALVGDGLLDGKLPYRDLWDFKPPAIYFAYALAQALFGKSMLSVRLLEIAGLFASMWAFGRLGRTFFDNRTAGYLGGAIAALIHAQLDFWHTAQPETFGGFLTLFALVATTDGYTGRKKFWGWIVVGVLFGLAFLFKPPLGGGALVCAAYLAKKEQIAAERRFAPVWPVLCVGVSALSVLALCVLWFMLRGGWPALWWTLGEFTPGYTSLGWQGQGAAAMLYYAAEEAFFKFSALSAAGVIAAATMSPMHGREREGVFLTLGIVALHITGIAMQGKFFPYHYGATLPLIAFIAGLGYYKLWRRCLAGGVGGVLAYAAFIVAVTAMRDAVRDLPQGFWQRAQYRLAYVFRQPPYHDREALDRELYYVADYNLDADRAVALELRSRTSSEDPVFVWGFEPVIYWLAERAPSSRFIYNVPQRTEWERDYARRELMRELEKRPPQVFVVQRNDIFPAVTGQNTDSKDDLLDFAELMLWLGARYEKVAVIEDFELYERRQEKLGAR